MCKCKPGNYENGWQESRSPECEAIERNAWRQAFKTIRNNLNQLTKIQER